MKVHHYFPTPTHKLKSADCTKSARTDKMYRQAGKLTTIPILNWNRLSAFNRPCHLCFTCLCFSLLSCDPIIVFENLMP